MRKYFILLLAALASCGGESTEPANIRREIVKILDSQKESWNVGSLEGYMDHYMKGDNLTFQSGAKLIRGWKSLDSLYAENYSGEKMGKLEFSGIRVKPLAADAAYVTGIWEVEQPDTARNGRFTLIMRKAGGRWKIVHDHTS